MSLKNNYPTIMPSLAMDFVNCTVLSPLVTFSRSSIATRVNSIGLIETVGNNVPRFDYDPVTLAPKGLLIEEQRTNLLTYSEQFDNAAWTKSNSSVLTNLLTYSQEFDNAAWVKSPNATATANVITAPDGTITCDKISYLGSSTAPQQTVSSLTTTYSFSAFVKKGNTSFCRLRLGATAGGSGTSVSVHFNIDTGVVSAVGAATADFGAITASITQATNGFYRISITFTVLTATTSIAYSIIAAQVSGGGSSNGDEIYIWGAQLVQGTNPEQYTVTTSAPAPIQVTSPLGFVGAQKLVEDTATTTHFAQQAYTVTSGTPYTISAYVKAGECSYVSLLFASAGFGTNTLDYFNLQTGTVASTQSGTAAIQSIGNGWYRISATRAATASVSTLFQIRLAVGTPTLTSTYTGDGTSGIYIFGAQLEAGSFPTSYIPTTTAQVTRTADNASMVGTNFSSWYNQSEGTIAVEVDYSSISTYSTVFDINDGDDPAAYRIRMIGWNNGTDRTLNVKVNNVDQVNFANTNTIGSQKYAVCYKLNDFAAAKRGNITNIATSGLIPNVNRMQLGSYNLTQFYLNGHIKSFKYYPQRLSNAQLQTLSK